MTKHITLKEWQDSFKSKNATDAVEPSCIQENDDFNARLDKIIADAGKVAVRKYQSNIQPVLYQIDRVCAGIANELVQNHSPESIYMPFSDAWTEVKKLIWEIENGIVK